MSIDNRYKDAPKEAVEVWAGCAALFLILGILYGLGLIIHGAFQQFKEPEVMVVENAWQARALIRQCVKIDGGTAIINQVSANRWEIKCPQ